LRRLALLNLRRSQRKQSRNKPKVELFDLSSTGKESESSIPLWVGKQPVNHEFPIYKFKVDKGLYKIDESK
jgi:hypothetical protein